MEIELKYSIPDPSVIDDMWAEDVFQEFGEIDIDSQVEMRAVYYDTSEMILNREQAAFRIRMENGQPVATLKWGDSQQDGLFEREELNIKLTGERCRRPSLQLFSESATGRRLAEKIGDRPLEEVLRTEYLRKIKRVDTGRVIFEADLDEGEIITSEGTLRICELELEHFSGDIDEMIRIGKKLADRYGLQTGAESKYARGMALLEEREGSVKSGE